jgi:hypothetical protein
MFLTLLFFAACLAESNASSMPPWRGARPEQAQQAHPECKIPRVSAETSINSIFADNKPVIVPLQPDWSLAAEAWSKEALAALIPLVAPVKVRTARKQQSAQHSADIKKLPLRTFLEDMSTTNGTTMLFDEDSFCSQFPAPCSRHGIPAEWLGALSGGPGSYFASIGPAGSGLDHHHHKDSLFAHLHGAKSWLLFPPSALPTPATFAAYPACVINAGGLLSL